MFKQTANSRRLWFELGLVITVALLECSGSYLLLNKALGLFRGSGLNVDLGVSYLEKSVGLF